MSLEDAFVVQQALQDCTLPTSPCRVNTSRRMSHFVNIPQRADPGALDRHSFNCDSSSAGLKAFPFLVKCQSMPHTREGRHSLVSGALGGGQQLHDVFDVFGKHSSNSSNASSSSSSNSRFQRQHSGSFLERGIMPKGG